MAPDPRVLEAFRAMKNLGISPETVSPVLKNLLKLYNKNWELIEEDNYRTLADAIFEYADDKVYSFTKYYFFSTILTLSSFSYHLPFLVVYDFLANFIPLPFFRKGKIRRKMPWSMMGQNLH